MTGRDGDDPYRDWDAAYVLGSLGPVDRRAFEDHLRTCAECRAAVAELAGLPGLLRMVPPDEAAASGGAAGDDEVVELTSLARAARRDRRRRSALLAGAAAALVLLAGVAGALLGRPAAAPVAAPSTSAQVSTLRLEPVGTVDVTADLTLQSKAWGTRIDWECSYPGLASPYDAGVTYELVLVGADGTSTVVATWLARDVGARGLGASSSIPTDTIQRVEIRVEGSDAPLAAAVT